MHGCNLEYFQYLVRYPKCKYKYILQIIMIGYQLFISYRAKIAFKVTFVGNYFDVSLLFIFFLFLRPWSRILDTPVSATMAAVGAAEPSEK
jgi:hypothetical protein